MENKRSNFALILHIIIKSDSNNYEYFIVSNSRSCICESRNDEMKRKHRAYQIFTLRRTKNKR